MTAELPRSGLVEGDAHLFPVRVYYEDTDAGGVVYHASYLRYAERARTEMLRRLGIDHVRLRDVDGIGLVVRRVNAEFRAPARLDDDLVVETRLRRFAGASLDLSQDLRRDATPLAQLQVSVACVDTTGRPARMPASLRAALLSVNPALDRMVPVHAK